MPRHPPWNATPQLAALVMQAHALDIHRAPSNIAGPPKPASNKDGTHEKCRDAPMHVSHGIDSYRKRRSHAMPSPPAWNALSKSCSTCHAIACWIFTERQGTLLFLPSLHPTMTALMRSTEMHRCNPHMPYTYCTRRSQAMLCHPA